MEKMLLRVASIAFCIPVGLAAGITVFVGCVVMGFTGNKFAGERVMNWMLGE
jgi:hypothetical protein